MPNTKDAPAVFDHDILTRPDGSTIAYRRIAGKSSATGGPGRPGVMFLGGFASDMTGTKATALESHCRERGQAFIRFDYGGHGRSSGVLREGTIGRWRDDALAVLNDLTDGPQILIGSSMGGWIMLLAALARPERVAALIGIAAAPDFTEDLIWAAMSDDQRDELMRRGAMALPSAHDETPHEIGRDLIAEGRRHLLLRAPIAIRCPVRLLHGMADPDVPYETSVRLAALLVSPDVVVTLIKDGDHRLSRDTDLQRLTAALDALS